LFVRAVLHSGVGSANLCSTAAAFKPDMAAFSKCRIQHSELRTLNPEP
jgi:hypothetical protein